MLIVVRNTRFNANSGMFTELSPVDTVVFIESGVYAADQFSKAHTNASIYALEADVVKRGLSINTSTLTDEQFAQMTHENTPWITL